MGSVNYARRWRRVWRVARVPGTLPVRCLFDVKDRRRNPMALYEQHDPRAQVDDPNYVPRSSAPALSTAAVLVFVAAVIAVSMIAVFYPASESRVGDTNNAGPSVRTVNPAPTPSTSPAVATPNPTTEPRPTQAPQP
jgi:hypothetical protein